MTCSYFSSINVKYETFFLMFLILSYLFSGNFGDDEKTLEGRKEVGGGREGGKERERKEEREKERRKEKERRGEGMKDLRISN